MVWTDPTTPETPLIWWDGNDTTNLVLSGSDITSWENKGSAGGGTGRSATNEFSVDHAVSAGLADFMSLLFITTNPGSVAPSTIFVVFRRNSGAAVSSAFLVEWFNDDDGDSTWVTLETDGSVQVQTRNNFSVIGDVSSVPGDLKADESEWNILVVHIGAALTLKVNDSPDYVDLSAGSFVDGASVRIVRGGHVEVGELLIYNTEFGASDLTDGQVYLASVWQPQVVTDTLILDQIVQFEIPNKLVEDNLNLTMFDSNAVGVVRNVSLTDTLSLSGVVEGHREFPESVADTISISDVIALSEIHGVADTLALTDTASAEELFNRFVVATLGLTDDVARDIAFQVIDTLALTQQATTPTVQVVTQALSLTDLIQVTVPLSLQDTLNLTQIVIAPKPTSLVDTLTFSDLRVGVGSKIITDTLALTDVISRAGSIYVRTLAHSLGLTDGAWHRLTELCDEEDFTPAAALGIYGFLTLTYPFTTPTLTLNLRVPKFGNIHRIDFGTVIRRLRGGALKTVKQATWPNIEELQLSFEHLSSTQKADLITFLTTSAGLEIGLKDQDNRQWKGLIISPINSISQARAADCSFETSFTFRGALQ